MLARVGGTSFMDSMVLYMILSFPSAEAALLLVTDATATPFAAESSDAVAAAVSAACEPRSDSTTPANSENSFVVSVAAAVAVDVVTALVVSPDDAMVVCCSEADASSC